jgi:hypothetical protein
MTRVVPRAGGHEDRNGDPLDGLVNLFDLAIVLAVAFLLAALSSLKLQDLLTGKDVTVVKNPGAAGQSIIVRKDQKVQVINPSAGTVVGQGARVGSVYRLSDGRLIYVQGK